MSDSKGYNGWSNYETWNVALWIGNDQGTSRLADEMAQEAYDNAESDKTFTRIERATLDLADSLKDWIEENNPLGSDASMYTDLLNAALDEVDYHEMAEHYLEDVDKEDEENESSECAETES